MDRFSFNWTPARKEAILEIGEVRLSVLTPCLLRVETGHFTDMPTQRVWNRDLGNVDFTVIEGEKLWTVRTGETEFSIDTQKGTVVSVTLCDGTVVTDFKKGNLLGTARTLDTVNGSTKLEDGILSRCGVSVMDDSDGLLLEQSGKILSRPACTDRYYFAYGHDYMRCLRDFFALTGPVPLIPKFALGNWWSRYRAYTQDEYQTLMAEFLDRKLPITVATIDMDWHWTDVLQRFGEDAKPGEDKNMEAKFYNRFLPGWTGYSWNTELFPDHKALLDWLHEKNFHVTLNVHPSQGIRFYEDCYAAACEKLGLDPADKAQIPFNVADTAFMEAYFDAAHHPLEDEGVDFWWLDWQQGKISAVAGLDPLWALNHYHTLDSGRGNKRPLILSRYAGPGSHRYPLGFSGDTHCTWKSLAFQPYFTNTAANVGYTWWSHDIGGHMRGEQDDELYLRWLQYGVFSPINRLHSSNSDFMGKEPWKRCFAVQTAAERFLRLRQKLIPYLYSANYLTHTDGTPICMPLYYVYDREEAYEVGNEYLFGSQLLVCPITEKSDRRLNLAKVRAWLPEGRWTDIFTGRIYSGGQWVNLYRDLDAIPVLAPQGTIVPMYASGETNDLSLEQPLEIHIWRGNGTYTLYEDDGETNAYQQGHFAKTQFTVEESGSTLRFAIHVPTGDREVLPDSRSITLHFRDITTAEILIDGQSISAARGKYVTVPLTVSNAPVTVELRNCAVAVNRPRQELTTELLTRVQAGNGWKLRRFPSGGCQKKRPMPGHILDALSELDALYYDE